VSRISELAVLQALLASQSTHLDALRSVGQRLLEELLEKENSDGAMQLLERRNSIFNEFNALVLPRSLTLEGIVSNPDLSSLNALVQQIQTQVQDILQQNEDIHHALQNRADSILGQLGVVNRALNVENTFHPPASQRRGLILDETL